MPYVIFHLTVAMEIDTSCKKEERTVWSMKFIYENLSTKKIITTIFWNKWLTDVFFEDNLLIICQKEQHFGVRDVTWRNVTWYHVLMSHEKKLFHYIFKECQISPQCGCLQKQKDLISWQRVFFIHVATKRDSSTHVQRICLTIYNLLRESFN